ncbi:MAG: hypothetical protein JRN66_09120, partial [Nitrososphaerota archaeon]|nr:hypothetical protein [Nitrososphaerota archaeon]
EISSSLRYTSPFAMIVAYHLDYCIGGVSYVSWSYKQSLTILDIWTAPRLVTFLKSTTMVFISRGVLLGKK